MESEHSKIKTYISYLLVGSGSCGLVLITGKYLIDGNFIYTNNISLGLITGSIIGFYTGIFTIGYIMDILHLKENTLLTLNDEVQ